MPGALRRRAFDVALGLQNSANTPHVFFDDGDHNDPKES